MKRQESVKVPQELHTRIKELAKIEGRSMGGLIKTMIDERNQPIAHPKDSKLIKVDQLLLLDLLDDVGALKMYPTIAQVSVDDVLMPYKKYFKEVLNAE